MGTFTSKYLVDQIIAGGGWPLDDDYPHDAPDNPQVVRIVEYDTPEGRTCWGVVFKAESHPRRYDVETPFIRRPRLIWAREDIA